MVITGLPARIHTFKELYIIIIINLYILSSLFTCDNVLVGIPNKLLIHIYHDFSLENKYRIYK